MDKKQVRNHPRRPFLAFEMRLNLQTRSSNVPQRYPRSPQVATSAGPMYLKRINNVKRKLNYIHELRSHLNLFPNYLANSVSTSHCCLRQTSAGGKETSADNMAREDEVFYGKQSFDVVATEERMLTSP